MADSQDYYELLGVSRDADSRTIKRAFLKKARELHPDVSDDPDAEEKFKKVNEAYSVLSDEQKRANYDRYGSAEGPMGGGYVDFSDIFGGGGLDDIFSTFFGGMGGNGHGGSQRRRDGRDMAVSLNITLEEAALGCKKTLSYERLAPCEDCHATGMADGATEKTCPTCGGTGYVTTYQRSIFGQVQSTAPCPDCNGEGTICDNPCDMCNGQGRTPNAEKIDVDIPAGISTGRKIRIAGYGEAGYRGAKCGDLIVTVNVKEHERFKRSGDDLLVRADISMVQAALGCTLEISGILPNEQVSVSVPAGTQFGDHVKVTGYGMPHLGTDKRGSLIVTVFISIPKKLTSEQHKLLEQYAALVGDSTSDKKPGIGQRVRNAIDDMLD